MKAKDSINFVEECGRIEEEVKKQKLNGTAEALMTIYKALDAVKTCYSQEVFNIYGAEGDESRELQIYSALSKAQQLISQDVAVSIAQQIM